MIQRRYEISDEQWEQIKGMFPPYKTGRPTKLSERTMFNAFLWIARSGCCLARSTGGTLWFMENGLQSLLQAARYRTACRDLPNSSGRT